MIRFIVVKQYFMFNLWFWNIKNDVPYLSLLHKESYMLVTIFTPFGNDRNLSSVVSLLMKSALRRKQYTCINLTFKSFAA